MVEAQADASLASCGWCILLGTSSRVDASLTYKAEQQIERVFGMLTCTAGGLSNLPAWVRGLERVRRWVGVKIVMYNARLELAARLQAHTAA